jgi:hypothetical protein
LIFFPGFICERGAGCFPYMMEAFFDSVVVFFITSGDGLSVHVCFGGKAIPKTVIASDDYLFSVEPAAASLDFDSLVDCVKPEFEVVHHVVAIERHIFEDNRLLACVAVEPFIVGGFEIVAINAYNFSGESGFA